jgi:hypothetical protein
MVAMSEKAENQQNEDKINTHVLIIAFLVMMALALAVILNKKMGQNSSDVKSGAVSSAIVQPAKQEAVAQQSTNAVQPARTVVDEDGWVTAIDPSGTDRFVASFIMRSLPQCKTFNYKTIDDGVALGVKCFASEGPVSPDFYYLLNETRDFRGPFADQDAMLEAIKLEVVNLDGSDQDESSPSEQADEE